MVPGFLLDMALPSLNSHGESTKHMEIQRDAGPGSEVIITYRRIALCRQDEAPELATVCDSMHKQTGKKIDNTSTNTYVCVYIYIH